MSDPSRASLRQQGKDPDKNNEWKTISTSKKTKSPKPDMIESQTNDNRKIKTENSSDKSTDIPSVFASEQLKTILEQSLNEKFEKLLDEKFEKQAHAIKEDVSESFNSKISTVLKTVDKKVCEKLGNKHHYVRCAEM